VFEQLVWTRGYVFNEEHRSYAKYIHALMTLLFVVYIYFTVLVQKSLIIDSSIFYDFSYINRFSIYTFTAIFIIIGNALSLWFITECFLLYVLRKKVSLGLQLLSILGSLILLFCIVYLGSGKNLQVALVAGVLCALLVLIIRSTAHYSFLKRFF